MTTTSSVSTETLSSSLDGFSVELMAADEAEIYQEDFSDFGFDPVLGVLHSDKWMVISAMFLLVSLYLADISLVFLSVEMDVIVLACYVGIAVVFFVEFIVLCYKQDGYLFQTIWFWADLLSLLSLVVDCIPLSVKADQPENGTNAMDTFVNSLRLLRLLRMWRVFKVLGLMSVYNNDKDGYAAIRAKTFSTYTSMKSGLILIILCILISNLIYDSNYAGPPLALELLETVEDPSLFNNILEILVDSYPVFSLEIDGVLVYDAGDDEEDFRSMELEDFTTERSALTLDVSEIVSATAVLNIISITLVLFAFMIATFMIRRETLNEHTVVFKEFLNRITKISKNARVYTVTDDIYSNPEVFYSELLEKLRKKVKANK